MNRSVLLVEDDPGVRTSLAKALERGSWTVHQAGEGAAALRLLEAGGIDLVVTDIFMPGREGLETIRDIRKRHPDVPIVAMSGGGERVHMDVLTLARKFGADRVFSKPLDLPAFLAAVEELLDPSS